MTVCRKTRQPLSLDTLSPHVRPKPHGNSIELRFATVSQVQEHTRASGGTEEEQLKGELQLQELDSVTQYHARYQGLKPIDKASRAATSTLRPRTTTPTGSGQEKLAHKRGADDIDSSNRGAVQTKTHCQGETHLKTRTTASHDDRQMQVKGTVCVGAKEPGRDISRGLRDAS